MYIVNGQYHATLDDAIEDASERVILLDDGTPYGVQVTNEQHEVVACVSRDGISRMIAGEVITFEYSKGDSDE